MTFWASLFVGISEPPASQVQQHPRVQVDGFSDGNESVEQSEDLEKGERETLIGSPVTQNSSWEE